DHRAVQLSDRIQQPVDHLINPCAGVSPQAVALTPILTHLPEVVMPRTVQACLLNRPDTVERRFQVRIQCASLLKEERASVEDFFAIATITLSPGRCFSLELGYALGAQWTRSKSVQPLSFSRRPDQELGRSAGISDYHDFDRPLITH